MTSARAFRTTSIQVEMVDGEDFVFKSISADREIIVKLIQNLMKDARFRSRNGGSSKYSAASSSPTMPTLNGSVAQPVMLQPRLRAHSAPTDVAAAEEDSASGPALSASPQRVEVTPLPSRKASTETTDSSVMTDNNTEHAWTEAIGVAAYKDTIVNVSAAEMARSSMMLF